jgi:iron complex transport system ATP-binding protein
MGSPLNADADQAGDGNATPPAGQSAIELRHVTVMRGGRALLNDVSWSVPAGAVAAVLGHNGSGKSTLARVLMGQMWPASGEVSVLGERFGQTDLNQLRESIRIVQPAGGVTFGSDQTLLDVVLTGYFGTVGLYRPVTGPMRDRAESIVHRVGLRVQSGSKFGTLSSGERMRCLIARAVVTTPRLLILDEVTAGLDLLAREQVLATVHRLVTAAVEPPTVLMITHHVEELLPQTSAVLLLKDGRALAAGPPERVLTTEVLSEAYDFPVRVESRDRRYWLSVSPSAWDALVPDQVTERTLA